MGKVKLLILHVAYAFGGAERTTDNLLRHLDRTRFSEVILASSGKLKDHFGGYDRFVDVSGLRGWVDTPAAFLEDARRVAHLLKRERPDVVLAMMHYSSALLVSASLLGRLRVRRIASFRGPICEYMRYFEEGFRRKGFIHCLVALTARWADKVIVPSHGTKAELVRRYLVPAERIEVIPNGIDLAMVDEKMDEPLEDPDLVPGDRPVLCTVGRLAPEKNLSLLLRAFSLVRQKRDALLWVLGEGEERPKLEAYARALNIQDSVAFLGERRNIFPYLRHADVLIHTCLFEGFGYTLLEAMACGTPVIAADCPYGPREVLGDRYGILTSMDDASAIAHAVLSLLEDPSRRMQLSRLGRERAAQLSLSRMVRRYEPVLLEGQ